MEQTCCGSGPKMNRKLSLKLTTDATTAVRQRDVNILLTRVLFLSEPKCSNQTAPYQMTMLTVSSVQETTTVMYLDGLGPIRQTDFAVTQFMARF